MKIVIPVENKIPESPVCISFGRTPYFMLFDTENSSYAFLDNSAAESQGGAGIQAAQMLADSGAQALVTVRCGQNAADVLDAAQIKIYKAVDTSAKENAEMCLQGKLAVLTEIHDGFHQHGGSQQ